MARDSENIFKFLLENTSDPMILFDIDKIQITGMNKSASEFLSGSSEKDMRKLFHEEVIENLRAKEPSAQYPQILRDNPLSGGNVSFSSVGKNGILLLKSDFNMWCKQIIVGIKFPIAFFNIEGKLIYWNDKAVKLFGYSPEFLYRNSAVDIVDVLTVKKNTNRKLKAFREGVNIFLSKSGKEIKVECSNSLIKDANGKVSGVLTIMKEQVTESESVDIIKNKVQEELLLSETRFRMLFQQSPLIIQIFNSEGDLIKYNSCFTKTWDIDLDKIKDYNLYEDEQLMNSEISTSLERAKMGKFSEIAPIKFHPKFAEHYIWMRGFIYPVTTNMHNEMVLILENITDQKKIEESFGIEASYRNAIESSISAGIAVVDLQGKQTYVNDAFCRMVGWSKEELVGLYPPFIYWAEDNLNEIETAFNETVNGIPSSHGYELRFKKKNNEHFDVLVIINPLKNAVGKIEGWLASVSDISRLKTVEKEIKHSLREKEVLLKEIHHRVKNNLQIISSLLNLQLNYIHDEEMQTIFKESQNRVMSMALIHQKLYLSKNHLNIDLQEYINELIQHLIKSYNAANKIDYKVQVDDVRLDNDKVVILGLILNELISNSLQYAFPEGKRGNIQVQMSNTSYGISLVIKDNGKGFPSGINYKKTHSLGLQLVNTLVDQLGGMIKLRQQNGTEFDIVFNSRRKFN